MSRTCGCNRLVGERGAVAGPRPAPVGRGLGWTRPLRKLVPRTPWPRDKWAILSPCSYAPLGSTICRRSTGSARSPELLGHVYAGPYVVAPLTRSVVVLDEEGVGGYLLCARDTRAHEAW